MTNSTWATVRSELCKENDKIKPSSRNLQILRLAKVFHALHDVRTCLVLPSEIFQIVAGVKG
jgi:hypothetical protein